MLVKILFTYGLIDESGFKNAVRFFPENLGSHEKNPNLSQVEKKFSYKPSITETSSWFQNRVLVSTYNLVMLGLMDQK